MWAWQVSWRLMYCSDPLTIHRQSTFNIRGDKKFRGHVWGRNDTFQDLVDGCLEDLQSLWGRISKSWTLRRIADDIFPRGIYMKMFRCQWVLWLCEFNSSLAYLIVTSQDQVLIYDNVCTTTTAMVRFRCQQSYGKFGTQTTWGINHLKFSCPHVRSVYTSYLL